MSDRHSFEWGIFWMLLSATALSISFLFLKFNLEYLDYFFLLFLRFFLPFIVALGAVLISWKWRELVASWNIWLQLARCACVLISQYGIAYYMTKNTLLNATVLLNASPLFIPLIEWVCLKQHPHPGKSTILGALLAFFGVILVLHPDRSLFTAISGIGLLAALGQAGSQVLYGLKPQQESPLMSIFHLFFLSSLFSLAVFLISRNGFLAESQNSISPTSPWLLGLSVVAMALGTLFNQYFRGFAYRCGRPSTLATFLYFAVFVSAVLDWWVYKIIPTPHVIIGSCLIILGGIVKIYLRAQILKKRSKQ